MIVFTNGCFDIIHAGHIKLLKEAWKINRLPVTVGINTDESIRQIKGDNRPFFKLEHRIDVLESIRYVGKIIPFNETTPEKLVRYLKPDFIVKGVDWKDKEVVEFDFVESYGGKVVFVDLLTGFSTTNIIKS